MNKLMFIGVADMVLVRQYPTDVRWHGLMMDRLTTKPSDDTMSLPHVNGLINR